MEIRLPMAGRHNAVNALAVWAAARGDGLAAADVASALDRFRGVRRRQEEVGTARGVIVVDDFAHHPTAVRETLSALAERYKGKRLVAVFEPRSLTAGRKMFHDAYREAFAVALAELAAAGTPADVEAGADELLERLLDEAAAGDVIVTMSSGEFGRLPRRLFERLDRGR